MKRCPRCGITRPLDEFHRHSKRKDGHQPYCKACRAEIDHARYLRRCPSAESHPRGPRAPDPADAEWLRSLKVDRPCSDCGRIFPPEAMQWDHLPGHPKRGEISNMRGMSKADVLDEIAKCELVCANCHVLRTFKRAGWTVRESAGTYRTGLQAA